MSVQSCRQLIEQWLDATLSESQKNDLESAIEAQILLFPELSHEWQAAKFTAQSLRVARDWQTPPPPFLRGDIQNALQTRSTLSPPLWRRSSSPLWAGSALAALALFFFTRDFTGVAPSLSPDTSGAFKPNAPVASPQPTKRPFPSPVAPVSAKPTSPALPRLIRSKPFTTLPKGTPVPRDEIALSRPISPRVATASQKPPTQQSPRLARPQPQTKLPRQPTMPATSPPADSHSASARKIVPGKPLDPSPESLVPSLSFQKAISKSAASQSRTDEIQKRGVTPLFSLQAQAVSDTRKTASAAEQNQPLQAPMMESPASEINNTAVRTVKIRLISANDVKSVRLFRDQIELWRGDLQAQKALELELEVPQTDAQIELRLETTTSLPFESPVNLHATIE